MGAQITPPQMFMLNYINKEKLCRLTQLADKMEVKPSAVTVMIDRLEKSGYVTRVHDTVDRRSILVKITPAGMDILARATAVRNRIIGHYLSRLETEEIEEVTALLEKMLNIAPGDSLE
jgi:DNA-binding MarR family transcriptional regulator